MSFKDLDFDFTEFVETPNGWVLRDIVFSKNDMLICIFAVIFTLVLWFCVAVSGYWERTHDIWGLVFLSGPFYLMLLLYSFWGRYRTELNRNTKMVTVSYRRLGVLTRREKIPFSDCRRVALLPMGADGNHHRGGYWGGSYRHPRFAGIYDHIAIYARDRPPLRTTWFSMKDWEQAEHIMKIMRSELDIQIA